MVPLSFFLWQTPRTVTKSSSDHPAGARVQTDGGGPGGRGRPQVAHTSGAIPAVEFSRVRDGGRSMEMESEAHGHGSLQHVQGQAFGGGSSPGCPPAWMCLPPPPPPSQGMYGYAPQQWQGGDQSVAPWDSRTAQQWGPPGFAAQLHPSMQGGAGYPQLSAVTRDSSAPQWVGGNPSDVDQNQDSAAVSSRGSTGECERNVRRRVAVSGSSQDSQEGRFDGSASTSPAVGGQYVQARDEYLDWDGLFGLDSECPGLPPIIHNIDAVARPSADVQRRPRPPQKKSGAARSEKAARSPSPPAAAKPMVPLVTRQLPDFNALQGESLFVQFLADVQMTPDRTQELMQELLSMFADGSGSWFEDCFHGVPVPDYVRAALLLEARFVDFLKDIPVQGSVTHMSNLTHCTPEFLDSLNLDYIDSREIEHEYSWKNELNALQQIRASVFEFSPIVLFSSTFNFLACVHAVSSCFLDVILLCLSFVLTCFRLRATPSTVSMASQEKEIPRSTLRTLGC